MPRAVSRAWSDRSGADARLPEAGMPPRALGNTPPGVVLSAPQSPMLAGAVALAAGRFQPLIRMRETEQWPGRTILTVRTVTSAVGQALAVCPRRGRAHRLGDAVLRPAGRRLRFLDDCRRLAVSVNRSSWDHPCVGIYALDDLIGRRSCGARPGLAQSSPRALGVLRAAAGRSGRERCPCDGGPVPAARRRDTLGHLRVRLPRYQFAVTPAVGFLGRSGRIRGTIVHGSGPGRAWPTGPGSWTRGTASA